MNYKIVFKLLRIYFDPQKPYWCLIRTKSLYKFSLVGNTILVFILYQMYFDEVSITRCLNKYKSLHYISHVKGKNLNKTSTYKPLAFCVKCWLLRFIPIITQKSVYTSRKTSSFFNVLSRWIIHFIENNIFYHLRFSR